MKYIKFLITAALAMLAFTVPAQNVPRMAFAGGGVQNTVSTNLCYYVVPHDLGGRPVVTFVSASSDVAAAAGATGVTSASTGGLLKFYSIQEVTPVILATTAATTNQIQVLNGTNFTSNTICILQVSTNNGAYSYQRLVANTNTSVTNVTFSSSTGGSVAVGDRLYRCRLESTIPVGSATLNLNAAGGTIYTWRQGHPGLVEVQGTGTNVINIHVAGIAIPVVPGGGME